ncbi:MAG: L-threonylcarbamoyladenylate synthase [Nanoarchaeota archaeon]|nr:L-threonylcarbamoyladenylate synthase [Nanoarchaeota archaeon]
MRTITKDELLINKFSFFKTIKDGTLFIYPTDTIYGIGCDATNEGAVEKLRALKEQKDRPFSVIAPDLAWIEDNCTIIDGSEDWLKKLPGPFTLIFQLKKPGCVAKAVNLGGKTLGVRLLDHWIQEFVKEYGRPIVTTSANKVGKIFMTSSEDLDPDLAQGISLLVYEGEKEGSASNIVDLSTTKHKVKER